MDNAGTLWSLPSLMVSPCLHLHLSGGDECFEVKERVSLLDESVHATFLQSQFVEKHLLVLVSLQTGNVLFCLTCDYESLCAFLLGNLLDTTGVVVAALGRSLIHVANVEHRLCSEQEQVAGSLLLLL